MIDGATHITATDIGNGRTYEAKVVGYDPSHDVAVIQLQGASGLTTATLGDSSKLSLGDKVLGLGNAGGVGGTPSTAGGAITGLDKTITAGEAFGGKTQQLDGLIQTNANVQPGDSGGAVVDSQGHVIGMITAGAARFGFGLGSGRRGSAQSFAIPINRLTRTASQIVAGHGSTTVHIGAERLPRRAALVRLLRLGSHLGRDGRRRAEWPARGTRGTRRRRRDHLDRRPLGRLARRDRLAHVRAPPRRHREGDLDGRVGPVAERGDPARERPSRLKTALTVVGSLPGWRPRR